MVRFSRKVKGRYSKIIRQFLPIDLYLNLYHSCRMVGADEAKVLWGPFILPSPFHCFFCVFYSHSNFTLMSLLCSRFCLTIYLSQFCLHILAVNSFSSFRLSLFYNIYRSTFTVSMRLLLLTYLLLLYFSLCCLNIFSFSNIFYWRVGQALNNFTLRIGDDN